MATKAKKVTVSDLRHGRTLWRVVNDHYGPRIIRIFVTSTMKNHGEFDGLYFKVRAFRIPNRPPLLHWLRSFEGSEMYTTKKAAERALKRKFKI